MSQLKLPFEPPMHDSGRVYQRTEAEKKEWYKRFENRIASHLRLLEARKQASESLAKLAAMPVGTKYVS